MHVYDALHVSCCTALLQIKTLAHSRKVDASQKYFLRIREVGQGGTVGWPKWLKSLGTAGTSAFPILFTKLFWKMAKKFKNFGVLGCLIAVEEMADFTL